MATSLGGISLSDKRVEEILGVAKYWCVSNGIALRSEEPQSSKFVCAPFALFPTVVPSVVLAQAKGTMKHFNRLMFRVGMDHQFLEQSLKNVIEVDDFMCKLWNVYCKSRENGIKQPIMLGLFRNDFMVNCSDQNGGTCCNPELRTDCLQLKQIEFNTIASGFAGLIHRAWALHRMTLGLAGKEFTSSQAPENRPALGLASGMIKAWELYGNPKAVIVFIVSSDERNLFDQRTLEFCVYEVNEQVRVLRKTLMDFSVRGSLDKDSNLMIDGDEVAVVYYRDGYTADNFSSQKQWDAKLTIELSRAIKCPSIQQQLVGAKKIQQELARPGALERFMDDPEMIKAVRETFADQFSLDLGPDGDSAVSLAINSPEKFVLKPQREGGGHNIYGDNIPKFFKEHGNSKERNAYILMERIFPLQQQNFLYKEGVPFQLSTVESELGFYGVYIGDTDLKEYENTECGHMMRTKVAGTDEGGVCAGFAVLDSPLVL